MCEVATAAALAMQVVGGGLKAQADSRALGYEAQVEENNAVLADAAAADALAQGAQAVGRIRTASSKAKGAARVAMAANGVELTSASAGDVLADSAQAEEQDVLETRANAARAAWGYGVEAQTRRESARVKRLAGQQAVGNSFMAQMGYVANSTANAPGFKKGG